MLERTYVKILVTGGAGYIGSHTVIELIKAGHKPVIFDNLCNSSEVVIKRLKKITGADVVFVKGDICDEKALSQLFAEYDFDACIHFAALKAVGESVKKPLLYYYNNITGTITLLKALRASGCNNIIFSSSATVYGKPDSNPIFETFPKKKPTNPYGNTKAIIEDILTDMQMVEPNMSVTLLRYFNPIGAHESGEIGEDPCGIPNNLMPYITQVAVGKLPKLNVFGDDYDTPDGTGVRDYIHVVDLACGHVVALDTLSNKPGVHIYNLGTSKGTSVLELVDAFKKASGVEIPYEICPRRAGDIDACWADCSKAENELGWKAKLDIERACFDSWNWQQKNPNGYNKK